VVAGDFDVQVDFALLSWPVLNSHNVRLGVMDFGIVVTPTGFGSGVGVIGPASSLSRARWSCPTDLHISPRPHAGRLRLIRTGSTLSGYVHDGNAWVLWGPERAARVRPASTWILGRAIPKLQVTLWSPSITSR